MPAPHQRNGRRMKSKIPMAELIQSRMQELGLSAEGLGFRLGYQNPAKAAGRVQALCNGHLENKRSRAALARLAAALEVPNAVVQAALDATRRLIDELRHRLVEQNRHARDLEENRWKAEFKPHAVIQTERRRPEQIVFCGLTGGTERWLIIQFDLSKPPITFVEQAVDALAKRRGDNHGQPIIPNP
jgi:transcriptional regulator with XRE-family HTH domain